MPNNAFLHKHNLLLFFCFLIGLCVVPLHAQTTIDYMTIDGEVWTEENSPYHIMNDVDVVDLTIEPGTEVLFFGAYLFSVSGILKAEGAEGDSIYFKPDESNTDGWQGIAFNGAATGTRLEYCVLTGSAANAVNVDNSNPAFIKSRIADNGADGISISSGQVELTRCVITGNGQHGLVVEAAGSAILKNCTITANEQNGVNNTDGSIELWNSIVAHNTKQGLFITGSGADMKMVNSVVAYNAGSGVFMTDAALDIMNSILYYNSSAQIGHSGGTVNVSYSDINQSGFSGSGNISEDPQFIDNASFKLDPTSPCVDTGNPDAQYNDRCFPPSLGTARNDMGAYGGEKACLWYEPLFVTPLEIDYGNVTRDSSKSAFITVKNYSDTILSINSIAINGQNAAYFSTAAQPFQLDPYDSLKFEVVFTPEETGLARAYVVIISDTGDEQVDLQGNGVIADIFVSPNSLDFGEVLLGDSLQLKLSVFNVGGDTLRIYSAQSSQSVFYPDKQSFDVIPFGSDSLLVTFKPDSAVDFSEQLQIMSNDPDDSPLDIPLQGTGIAPKIAFDPTALEFGGVKIPNDSIAVLKISNKGSAELVVDSTKIIGADLNSFSVLSGSAPFSLPANGSRSLQIRFKPDSIGQYSAQLRVISNDTQNSTAHIAMNGTGKAPFMIADKSEILFGNVYLPNDSTALLSIANTGNDTLRIDSLNISGPDSDQFSFTAAVLPLTVPVNDSEIIEIHFRPTDPFAKSAALHISGNDPFNPQTEITLQGTAIGPRISAGRDSIRFGELFVYSDSTIILPLFNLGNVDLNITDLQLEGDPSYTIVNQVKQFVITPGDERQTVEIKFAPMSEGDKTAILKILSSDPLYPIIEIPLIGKAVKPQIAVGPESYDFNQVLLRRDAVANFALVNLGSADLKIHQTGLMGTDASEFSIEKISAPLIIPVGADPESLLVRFTPLTLGSKNAFIRIISNDPLNDTLDVALSGKGVAPLITSDTLQLHFGAIDVFADSQRTLEIGNLGNVLLKVDSAGIAGQDLADFYIDPTQFPVEISPGAQKVKINVNFIPRSANEKTAQLHLYSNDPLQDTLKITLLGTGIAPEIAADSLVFSFGDVWLNRDSLATINIYNSGNQTLKVDSLKILGRDSALFTLDQREPFDIPAAGAPATLQIRFAPEYEASNEALLTLRSNDPVNPLYTIQLEGRGVKPTIAVTPEEIDFGTVVLSEQDMQNLAVSNTGSAPLTLEGLQFEGNHASEFSVPDDRFPMIIAPDSAIYDIAVFFAPTTLGEKQAELLILNNDFEQDTVNIRIRARGGLPVLSLNKEQLDFGRIIFGSDSTDVLELTNEGSAALRVDSVWIGGRDSANFTLSSVTVPFFIEPGTGSRILQMTFDPLTIGSKEAILKINSNDPNQSLNQVPLSGWSYVVDRPYIATNHGDSLNFGSIFVRENLIRKVFVYNHGDQSLTVTQLKISGPDEDNFAIGENTVPFTMPPADNPREFEVIMTPGSAGEKRAVLEIYSNDTQNNPCLVNLSGTGIIDQTPAAFTIDTANITFAMNSSTKIEAAISDDETTIHSVMLHIREGGSHAFSQLDFSKKEDNIWETEVPSDFIGVRGIEYYIEAVHGGTASTYPAEGAENPKSGIVQIAQVSLPAATKADSYQMISFPVDMLGQNLADLLNDDLGSYDNSRYRIFDWDNQNERFQELSDMNRTIKPGKALWLITKSAKHLDLDNVRSVTTGKDYTINLRAGWNMIAVPFAFPVAWKDVRKNAISGDKLYFYNGGGWQEATVMQPFAGYAVYALSDTVLSVPAEAAENNSTVPVTRVLGKDEWQIRITAGKKNKYDRYNFAGALKTAKADWDKFDCIKPPAVGEYVSVSFDKDNWPDYGGKYAEDFRPLTADGYEFDLNLQSNFDGKTTIEIEPENLPAGFDWVVIAPKSGIKYPKGNIETRANEKSFRLLVGSNTFLKDKLENFKNMPTRFEVSRNYPNPFNPSTTVKYQIPEDGFVSIQIYDILGRSVKILKQMHFADAGYYQVNWNGRNNSNRPVASGIYILTVKLNEKMKSVKMILQK